jgi:hypothetical protein
LFNDTSYEEIEVDPPNPTDETFIINDPMNRTATNNLDRPIDINNNDMKANKHVKRVKKGNGDGTPLTSKGSRNSIVQSASLGAKPKKLMDITNTKNDLHDETFKIPVNPVSTGKLTKIISFDDLNTDDESDREDSGMSHRHFAKWSLENHCQKMLEKQSWMGIEGEIMSELMKN